jgi:heme-degrading monooxygenase HmoA
MSERNRTINLPARDTFFRVLLRMEIIPELFQEFERTWLDVGNTVTSHPANLAQWLLRSTGDECVYYIVSDWVDEENFREFERSEAHLVHRKILHPYRASGTMQTMNAVYSLAGAAGGHQ